MQQVFKQYATLLRGGDSFFAIEVFDDLLRGTLVHVDAAAKRITVLQTEQCQIEMQPLDQCTQQIPALLARFHIPATVRMLALLDHHRATILTGSIGLMRSDGSAEITQAELKNLVSRGVWKLAQQHRGVAAKKMNIPAEQVQLADADVLQVRLDGHRVVNPVGFPARTVELSCRETFVDAQLLKQFSEALTDDNLAAVVESSAVIAGLVMRYHPSKEFLFISVGARETVLYHVQDMELRYLDSVHWGIQTLVDGLAQVFSVDTATARQMLRQYDQREVSPIMAKAIGTAASGELAILSNAIAAHQPAGLSIPVYVYAQLPLPEFLFDPAFSKKLGLQLELTSVNERFIGERSGFVVQWQQQRSASYEYTFDALVAVLADVYTASMSPLMTTAAKQRARWLQDAAGM